MSTADPGSGAGAAFWAARGVRIEPEPEQDGPQERHSDPRVADAVAHVETRAAPPVMAAPRESPPEAPPAPDGHGPVPVPGEIPAQATLDEVEPQGGAVVDGLAALSESLAESRRAKAERPKPEPVWQLTEGELAAPLPPLKTCLEAVLMVVDEPVTAMVLAQVVERPKAEVGAALRELAEEYSAAGRGFDLREVGVPDGQSGWRIYSRTECAPVVERFVRDGQQARLTQAALETLAVVAYRQPVSRSKVSAIRGVNCDGVMRTLLARGLVEECGTEHDTGALLYRTTGYFLERMGLKGLAELPDLAPLMPSAADLEDES